MQSFHGRGERAGAAGQSRTGDRNTFGALSHSLLHLTSLTTDCHTAAVQTESKNVNIRKRKQTEAI